MLEVKKSTNSSLPRNSIPAHSLNTRSPVKVAFDCQHQRIIASSHDNDGYVQSFDRATLKLHSMVGTKGDQLGQFTTPRGLSFQPFTHHLLVCDNTNNNVQVFSSSPIDEYKPLYVFGGNRNGLIASAHPYETAAFFHPFGVSCAPDGSVVVADTMRDRIQMLDTSGRFVRTFGQRGTGPQQFNNPHESSHLNRRFAPSSAASSLLLVADTENKRMAIWSADGRQAISHVYLGSAVDDVCVDLNGLVYASATQWTSEVKIYDLRRSGAESLLQTLGNTSGSDSNQFHWPRGMCVDDTNTLIVADHFNHRIQFFE